MAASLRAVSNEHVVVTTNLNNIDIEDLVAVGGHTAVVGYTHAEEAPPAADGMVVIHSAASAAESVHDTWTATAVAELAATQATADVGVVPGAAKQEALSAATEAADLASLMGF